ncbi:MAG: tRNA (uridine(34)/cytosine(34)/5-carboxymethylaminomethyluridine(34)-2'-O)-methyltransferase TrmL [Neisseriaceae bacterium]|nr:tRNA (uridine(34)/cytosine(34)/5-carboxymethylaminomethyluridine(34)-2'-O)-methyltransferase TrmL [Neisseriaceae bacterium]
MTLKNTLTIVLFEPEIPPNTGNIIRLCANTGSDLHLVKPLGFPLDDSKLIRAGLDYHEFTQIVVHENWADCLATLANRRLFFATTKASNSLYQIQFQTGDVLVFGPETRGLPACILEKAQTEHCIKIPMLATSRSLNLSNAVAISLYEAWRQLNFTLEEVPIANFK